MKKVIWELLRNRLGWLKHVWVLLVLLASVLAVGKLLMIDKDGPTWRGIIVGESSVKDVVTALGPPTSIDQESRHTVYIYAEGRIGKHRVIFSNQLVECVIEDALAYPGDIFCVSGYREIW